MIELKKIQLSNFLSYKNLLFNFEDKNLCLIVGTNGSGKSSIPSAVTWALFGRTQKGLQADQVIRWDSDGDCFVILNLVIDGTPCTIARSRGGSNEIILKIGEKSIDGTNTEKQKAIETLLGASFSTFINVTFFSQGKVKFLGEITDTEKKELFKRILDLEQFDRAYKLAGNRELKIYEEIQILYNQETKIQHNIDLTQQEYNFKKASSERFESDNKDKIKELTEVLEVIRNSQTANIEQKRELINKIAQIEKTLERDIGTEFREIQNKLSAAQTNVDIINIKLNELGRENICPTCGRPWDEDEHLTERVNKIEDLKKKLITAQKLLDKIINNYDTKAKEYDEWNKTKEWNTRLSILLETINKEEVNQQEEIKDIKEKLDFLNRTENPFPKDLITIKGIIDNSKKSLKELEDRISELQKEKNLISEVEEIFSKRGAISFIIENYFNMLSEKANYYLGLLNADISLEITAQTETKAGDKRESIDIKIQKGEQQTSYENLSDGERQRVNLVLLFAVYNLCRSLSVCDCDTLFLDEVLDLSLDNEAQEFVIELLKILQERERIPHILVISHAEGVKNQFSQILSVSKINGESKIDETNS